MPHWINLSFYSTNKKVAYSTFIPRIKLPPRVAKCHSNSLATCPRIKSLYEDEENALFHAPIDYDAYDSQVFALSSVHTSSLNRLSRLIKKTSVSLLESGSSKVLKRKMSDPDIHHESSNSLLPASGSSAISIPVRSEDDFLLQTNPSVLHINDNIKNRPSDSIYEGDSMNLSRVVVGSMGSPSNQIHQSNTFGSSIPLRPGRALINPFDPSHVTIKLTSNRRRWSHIFPKGPTGLLIQQHHYQAGPANDPTVKNGSATASSPPSNDNSVSTSKITRSASQVGLQEHIRMRSRPSILTLSGSFSSHHQINRKSTLLWGATGEQEWTPALTTVSKIIIGVDWKSLTIPACLPITTDYFPDEVCLKTDYVFSDYSLLPDGVNADFAQQRAIYRKPLSTQEVFRELVSQRLAQGFQLILETNTSQTPGALAPGSACLVGSRQQVVQPNLEYKLSIGRVFHHIVLNGSEIGVTRYRPKHPYPPFNVHYHYRFQAPDHDTYEVSWVSFNTEKLENYNWNYLDHYICTRGDTDFALAETLKYWRFRFYILPLSSVATKKILEGSEHCDLYTALTLDEQNRFAEIFLRYIEIWVNKIKRPNVHKKGRLELSSLNMTSQLTRRRHSTGIMFSPNSQEKHGRLSEKPALQRSGSKVMERGRASPATDVVGPLTGTIDNEHTDVVDDFIGDALVLKESASNQEIIEAMKHPVHGVGFFSPQISLPSNAFVSSDAVAWLKSHMDGISTQEQATVILENLRKERLICHASGEFSHPLIVGFCLYHIVAQEKGADYQAPLGDLKSFEDEWLEVEVRPSQPVSSVPSFLADKLPPDWKGCSYKHTHLEIDAQGKSDRVEWGHARYQSVYQPDRAFEMAVQWMAASGSITADLITVWARKAQTSGLLMIPIPPDPFALPYSQKSDPLRGPVFIPLDVECLMETRSYLFEDFSEDTWAQRLMLLQEAIAIRFGFIACSLEAGSQYLHYQYIHLSGNVFLMIPSVPCKEPTSRGRSASTQSVQQRYPTYSEVDGNPHQQYIIKQQEGSDTRVGFLWSWNHMTSRRWKWSAASAKSEEAFQNKLLSDFCHFCSNGDNRLKAFWDVSCTKGNS
uniref:DEP domain-containing protein n=1 Tax=Clastoptera arizonana TaxID=38151 RepID=A0A1B6CLL3_9HEMI